MTDDASLRQRIADRLPDAIWRTPSFDDGGVAPDDLDLDPSDESVPSSIDGAGAHPSIRITEAGPLDPVVYADEHLDEGKALHVIERLAELNGYDEIASAAYDRDLGPTTDRRDKDVHEQAAEKVASDLEGVHTPHADDPLEQIDRITKRHDLTATVRDAAVDGTRAGAFTPLDDLGSTADRERSDDETPNALECSGCGDRPLHIDDDLACVECGHPNDGGDEKPQSPSESWDIEDLLDDDLPTGDAMAGLLLEDAHGVVTASRDTHGDAVENQQHIAGGWTWYLRGKGLLDDDQRINGGDVGRMFPIAKMSRTAVGTYDVDHDRDVAGYAGIAAACEVDDGNADLEDLTGEAENRGA